MSAALWSLEPPLAGEARAAPPRARIDGATARSGSGDFEALLDQVLARTGVAGTPVVLVLPCLAQEAAPQIALGLALAGATRLGRTLRIEAGFADSAPLPQDADPRLPTERDPFVPALHHARFACGLFDRHAPEQPFAAQLEATSHAFRLVVIDCAAPGASAAALALAPLASGTLLLVAAFRTRLASIETAARMIVGAGGRLAGTVLVRTGRA